MKVESLVLKDADGANFTITTADYLKGIKSELGVAGFTSGEGEDSHAVEASTVLNHIFKSITSLPPTDIDPAINIPQYKPVIDRITADWAVNNEEKGATAKAADEAKKKKDADLEKKKEDAKQLLVVQGKFAESVISGLELASSEFVDDLKQIQENLAEGIIVNSSGAGFGISLGEGVTQETLGSTLGYLYGKEQTSSFLANQIQWWVGDIVSASVEKGIFTNASEAGKYLTTFLKDKGKSLNLQQIDAYKRMSDRTPVELRNPKVQPSAYLKISNMSEPKKGDKEDDASYKTRVTQFKEGRVELQKKLADGTLVTYKEIVPVVDKFLVDQGLKQPVDPNKAAGPGVMAIQHIQARIALDNLVDVHEPGVAIYRNPKDPEKLVKITRERLQALADEAYASFTNVMYTVKKGPITPANFFEGNIEKEEEQITKDASGGAVKTKVKVKTDVYPVAWFEEDEPAASEAPEETAPEAESPDLKRDYAEEVATA